MNPAFKAALVNDTRVVSHALAGNLFVHRYSILGTSCVIYSVYESDPKAYGLESGHSSFMTLKGHGPCGAVMSRKLPREIEAIKGPSRERSEACQAFWTKLAEMCILAIYEAYPESRDGKVDMGRGEVEVYDTPGHGRE